MREIAFDTETTGLDWRGDDRVIEVGAVELMNYIPTGKTFRMLINPGRPVSADTVRITGITDEMLIDQPSFDHPDIVDGLMAFIGDARIVAHNAGFDRGFLNAELMRCGRDPERTRAHRRPEGLPSLITEEEMAAHTAFLDRLGDKPLWRKG